MLKNSSIFNFNKLPKAFLLAVLIMVALEAGSKLLLLTIQVNCVGGDLIKMDKDLFCSNYKKYAEPRLQKTTPAKSGLSLEREMAKGNFDVIVFGSSVIDTGWVEQLNSDGINSYNTSLEYWRKEGSSFWRAFLQIIQWRDKKLPTAILLYADLTERAGRDLRNFFKPANNKISNTPGVLNFSNFSKLAEYLRNRGEEYLTGTGSRVIRLNSGKDELFSSRDINGLEMAPVYDSDDLLKISQGFKEVKEAAAKSGLIFTIAPFPTKPQQYEWLLLEGKVIQSPSKRINVSILKKIAQENSIPFLDLESELAPFARDEYQRTGRLFWWRDDTHMNDLGTRHTAAIVKNFVSRIKNNKIYNVRDKKT